MSEQPSGSSMLTSAETLDVRSNFKPVLPVKGTKEFEPSGSWLESKQLQCALQERKTMLEECRIEKVCHRSTAEWRPDLSRALVTQRVGKHFDVVGREEDKELWINAEEILFLLEMNQLEVWFGGMPMSVQQGYAVLLSPDTGCTMNEYIVYKHLCNNGYRVLRHNSTNNLTQYEVDIRLDQHLHQRTKAIIDASTTERRPSCEVVKERDVICVDSMPVDFMEEDPTYDERNTPSTSLSLTSFPEVCTEKDDTNEETSGLNEIVLKDEEVLPVVSIATEVAGEGRARVEPFEVCPDIHDAKKDNMIKETSGLNEVVFPPSSSKDEGVLPVVSIAMDVIGECRAHVEPVVVCTKVTDAKKDDTNKEPLGLNEMESSSSKDVIPVVSNALYVAGEGRARVEPFEVCPDITDAKKVDTITETSGLDELESSSSASKDEEVLPVVSIAMDVIGECRAHVEPVVVCTEVTDAKKDDTNKVTSGLNEVVFSSSSSKDEEVLPVVSNALDVEGKGKVSVETIELSAEESDAKRDDTNKETLGWNEIESSSSKNVIPVVSNALYVDGKGRASVETIELSAKKSDAKRDDTNKETLGWNEIESSSSKNVIPVVSNALYVGGKGRASVEPVVVCTEVMDAKKDDTNKETVGVNDVVSSPSKVVIPVVSIAMEVDGKCRASVEPVVVCTEVMDAKKDNTNKETSGLDELESSSSKDLLPVDFIAMEVDGECRASVEPVVVCIEVLDAKKDNTNKETSGLESSSSASKDVIPVVFIAMEVDDECESLNASKSVPTERCQKPVDDLKTATDEPHPLVSSSSPTLMEIPPSSDVEIVETHPHTDMSMWTSMTGTNDLFMSGLILGDWEEKKAPSPEDDDVTSASQDSLQILDDDDQEIIGISLERDSVQETSSKIDEVVDLQDHVITVPPPSDDEIPDVPSVSLPIVPRSQVDNTSSSTLPDIANKVTTDSESLEAASSCIIEKPNVAVEIVDEEESRERQDMPVVLLMNDDEELATASPHKVAPDVRIPTLVESSSEVTVVKPAEVETRPEEFIDYSTLQPGFNVIIKRNKCPVLVDLPLNTVIASTRKVPDTIVEVINLDSSEPSGTLAGNKRLADTSEPSSSKRPRLAVAVDDDINVVALDVESSPGHDSDRIIHVVSPDVAQSQDHDADCLELDIEGESSLNSDSSDGSLVVDDSDIEVVEIDDDSDIEVIEDINLSKRKRPANSGSLPSAKRPAADIEIVNLSDSDEATSDAESEVVASVTRKKYWTEELKQDQKRFDILTMIPNVANKVFMILNIPADMLPPDCIPNLQPRVNVHSLQAVGYGGKPTRDYRPAHQVHEERRLLEPILDYNPGGPPFGGQNCIINPAQNSMNPFNNYNTNPFNNLNTNPFNNLNMNPFNNFQNLHFQPNVQQPLFGMPYAPPLMPMNFPMIRPILRPRIQNSTVSGIRRWHSKPQAGPYQANGWFQQNNFFNRADVNEVLNRLSVIKPLLRFPGNIVNQLTPQMPTHIRWNEQTTVKVERNCVGPSQWIPAMKMEQDVKGNFPRFASVPSTSIAPALPMSALVKQETQQKTGRQARRARNKLRKKASLRDQQNSGSNSNPNLEPKVESSESSQSADDESPLNAETVAESPSLTNEITGTNLQPDLVTLNPNPATLIELQNAKEVNKKFQPIHNTYSSTLISEVISESNEDLMEVESIESPMADFLEELRRRDYERSKTYQTFKRLKLITRKKRTHSMMRANVEESDKESRTTSENESDCEILSNDSSEEQEEVESGSEATGDRDTRSFDEVSERISSRGDDVSCEGASQPVSRSGSDGNSSDYSHSVQEVSSGSEEEEDDVRPLVRPEDCINYATILSRLNIFKPASSDSVPNNEEVCRDHKVSFDVYKPPAGKSASPFRKSCPGVPDYRVVVLSVDDPVPNVLEAAALTHKCKDDAPTLFAVVTLGTVSFIRLGSVNIPVDLTDCSVKDAAG